MKRTATTTVPPWRLGVRIAQFTSTVVLVAACGSSAGLPSDTSAAPTVSSTPATTHGATTTSTTAPAPSTTEAQSALDKLGYPVSMDWVVETVISNIDSATGGLAVDADGYFYQADFGYTGHPGDSVYRISPKGEVETLVQSDTMESLTMTAFGPDGALYQTAYGSGQVFRIDPDGTFEILAEALRGPTGIVIDEDGTLYVESYTHDLIYRILPDGTVEDWATSPFLNGPNGLTRAPDGTFYAVDHKDGQLFSISPDGAVTQLHRFPSATSHVVYLDGSLFITSREAYVVFRWDLSTGQAEVIAGNGEPGNADGRGGEASFGRPNAITVGPDGALYTNHGDGNSNDPVSIRRISYQP